MKKETHREKAVWWQRQRLESYTCKPGTPKTAGQPLRKRQVRTFLQVSGETVLSGPLSQMYSLQNCETINIHCFKLPSLWHFVIAALETNTPHSLLMCVCVCVCVCVWGLEVEERDCQGLKQREEMGMDCPLEYSFLENPMGRGAWWAKATASQRVRRDLAGTHGSKMSLQPVVLKCS